MLASAALLRHDNSTYAGVTAISVNPTDNGDAQLSIAVPTAPASGGLRPKLSLAFSSQRLSSNLLGTGFHIAGIAHIAHCPATLATDGRVGAINFDGDDRFCVGDERLIAVDGAYGADGTVYATEVDTFTRFVSRGAQDGAPAHFEARTASGERLLFGATPDARMLAPGRQQVAVWKMSERRDPFDNFMMISYDPDPGSGTPTLARVAYGGNGGVLGADAIAPYHSIEFDYEPRPDTPAHFAAGMLLRNTQRLQRVRSVANGTQFMHFDLQYEQGCHSGTSRINQVTECSDVMGSPVCKPPTTLGWDEACTGAFVEQPGPSTKVATAVAMASLDQRRIMTGDFDGNGLTDIYYVNGFGTADTGEPDSVLLNQGGGKFIEKPGPSTAVRGSVLLASIDVSRIKILDLNADGAADVLVLNGWGDDAVPSSIFMNNGDGSFSSPTSGPAFPVSSTAPNAEVDLARVKFGDFDGNGLIDIFVVGTLPSPSKVYFNSPDGGGGTFSSPAADAPGATVRSLSTFAALDLSRVHCVDVDGNGLTDVLVFDSTGGVAQPALLHKNAGGKPLQAAFADPTRVGPAFAVSDMVAQAKVDLGRIRLAELNGDGAIDLYYVRGAGDSAVTHQFFLNQGNGTFGVAMDGPALVVSASLPQAAVDLQRIRVVDVNSDGLQDVHYTSGTGTDTEVRTYIASGSGFTLSNVSFPTVPVSLAVTQAPLDLQRLLPGDFNGDGGVDWYTINRGGDSAVPDSIHLSPFRTGQLARVTDGFGAVTEIEYKHLTDGAVYTKHSGASFPVKDVQNAAAVVSQVTKSDSRGTVHCTTYRYEGKKSQVQGIGSLGFQAATSTETETGITETHEYSQDWAHRMHYRRTGITRAQQNGTKIGTATRQWVSNQSAHQPSVFRVWNALTTETKFSLAGELLSNKTSAVEVDEFNHQTKEITAVTDRYTTYTTQMETEYLNDVRLDAWPHWRLGLVTSNTVTRSAGDALSEALTTHGETDYDNATGAVLSETVEPGDADLSMMRSYTHNRFGNRLTTKAEGKGVSRTTTLQYDALGRFAEVATGALGHVVRTQHHLVFGTAIKVVDANNLETVSDVDAFGAVIAQHLPDGSSTSSTRAWSSGEAGGHEIVLVVSSTTACGIETSSFYDAFGDVVRTAHPAFASPTLRTFQDATYNARGLQAAKSEPYFEGESAVLWSNTTFDVLNRPLVLTHPDQSTHNYTYDGLSTRATSLAVLTYDESSGRQRRFTQMRENDCMGRIRRMVDNDEGLGGPPNCTVYRYDAFNRMVQIQDAHGNTINTTFNARGFKMRVDDPDTGTNTFEYNALGQTVRSVDNANNWVLQEYDALGRLLNLTSAEGSNLWHYDTAPNGIGKLAAAERSDGKYSERHGFDAMGRAVNTTVVIDGSTFTSTVNKFDSCSRASDAIDAGGLVVHHEYDTATGLMVHVVGDVDSSAASPWWSLNAVDPYGRATNFTLGNGVTTVKTFDLASRQLLRISAVGPGTRDDNCPGLIGLGGHVQDLVMGYDPTGNLITRKDNCLPKQDQEQFFYDHMSRLNNYNAEGDITVRVDYDAIGNIKYKSTNGDKRAYRYCDATPPTPTPPPPPGPVRNQCDPTVSGGCTANVCAECCKAYLKDQHDCDQCVQSQCPHSAAGAHNASHAEAARSRQGDCTIAGGAGPHAVRQIVTVNVQQQELMNMQYDPIGAMVASHDDTDSRLSRTLAYNSMGQTISASRGKSSVSFLHSHAGAVVQRTEASGSDGDSTTTVTLPGFERVEGTNGAVECRHYVSTAVMVVSACDGKPTRTVYMGFDHQGSLNIVMDGDGNLLPGEDGRHSYDPFGRRRFGNWTLAPRGHDWGASSTDNGFAGHNDIAGLGLVQTPARMYDPYIGRFLSADPTIQSVKHSQMINRYSYAGNNPLALTDRTGFGWFSHMWHGITHFFSHVFHDIKHAILHSALLRDVLAVAFAVIPGLEFGAFALLADAIGSAVWSTALTKMEGGSWGAALTAGFESLAEAAVMYEAGSLAGGLGIPEGSLNSAKGFEGDLGRSLIHGVAGGGLNAAEGKKFTVGFETAFISEAFAPLAGSATSACHTVAAGDIVSGAIGGAASELGGGKFEDGFVTGMLSFQFNHMAHESKAEKAKFEAQKRKFWTKFGHWAEDHGLEYVKKGLEGASAVNGLHSLYKTGKGILGGTADALKTDLADLAKDGVADFVASVTGTDGVATAVGFLGGPEAALAVGVPVAYQYVMEMPGPEGSLARGIGYAAFGPLFGYPYQQMQQSLSEMK